MRTVFFFLGEGLLVFGVDAFFFFVGFSVRKIFFGGLWYRLGGMSGGELICLEHQSISDQKSLFLGRKLLRKKILGKIHTGS